MKKPLIGIVLDLEPNGDYSIYPYYVLRQDYFSAVEKAGGIPVGIPVSSESITDYVNNLDGLLLPGGDYDIPPSFYGSDEVHDSVVVKPGRLEFDVNLTKSFLAIDKPILGICLGEQLLAVILGGTLHQDIAAEVADTDDHYIEDRMLPVHTINVVEGTKLHQIVGGSIAVNSHHHQAVTDKGGDFIVSARSADGVVEAIEVPDKKFCLGMQWHPEHLIHEKELEIFEAFIDACR